MTTFTDNFARPDSFIRFHGLTMLVVENGGVRYAPAKPLSDLFGLAWRKTRETIQEGDNPEIYGTRQLVPLNFDVLPDLKVSPTPASPEADGGEETEIGSSRAVFYIRLDAVYLFMARINTSRVRVNGNVSTADFLLELQKEWRQVLYEYETNGFVVKKTHKDELLRMLKARGGKLSPQEEAALTELIGESFAALGKRLAPSPQMGFDAQWSKS